MAFTPTLPQYFPQATATGQVWTVYAIHHKPREFPPSTQAALAPNASASGLQEPLSADPILVPWRRTPGDSRTTEAAPPGPVSFPTPGTPAWGRMNRRRAELIRKNIRGELNAREQREYELLQRLSLAALEVAFPRTGDINREDKGP